ncbi:sulfatase-like hydrolase/transferase [Salinicola salarius]|uniref:sulfatase-like hydrolase/transferase n=1 Tax=Salinicola salarius TaxID=430457 RepID=UPI000DA1B4D6|nr:sulfatase-like hydrolase/transferase [Salinicola salarius]
MSQRPNVLVICTDHWSGSLLGCADHPAIQTPTLDALAKCGMRFERAYSESPVCVPARRTLMTGTMPRQHGDRTFQQDLPMPDLPTLAGTFREHGYQTFAVGKLHVFPQRSRIGFDDVILSEEGRNQWGLTDDYDAYLARKGYAGQRFGHGMSNNHYLSRPWHLPEETHEIQWATREMVRTIRRRDPTRPAFWYLSYSAPHPPITPVQSYLDMYDDEEIDMPVMGAWASNDDQLPVQLQKRQAADRPVGFNERAIRRARKAFYAQCTQIDHQLRLVIGALREEKLLDNTIILFTSDHGDMLGDHGLWAKRVYYEKSANIPMLLLGTTDDNRVKPGSVDDRLTGLQDIMPTLLHMADIPVPESVDGISMVDTPRREWLYGEYGEGTEATRMVHDGRYKLIYYPVGNRLQLFDLTDDPEEIRDRVSDPDLSAVRERLVELMIGELYGSDLEWIENGQLVGLPASPVASSPDRGLSQQRSIY